MHALVGSEDDMAAWRVAPMNKDERVVARRLLKAAPPEVVGYITADANYDSNLLHQVCDDQGNRQLVRPQRYGPGNGTGLRKQTAGRRRSMALTESPFPAFARRLLRHRSQVEREFGKLTNWSARLSGLPSWVRGHRRMRSCVQAKLALTRLKRDAQIKTCAV